jgi:hypothetical protein
VLCSGYRDTGQLRIRDQSRDVRIRALIKSHPTDYSIGLSLHSQARDAFFAHYVTGKSKTWDFLIQFYHPLDAPKHLELCIEAASLGYLSHLVYSDVAMKIARERYGKALGLMNTVLRSSEIASKNTTLLSSLMLDLFEKITNNKPQDHWSTHINGALGLVEVLGLQTFDDPAAIRILVRLSTNLLISCVASKTHVPYKLIILRKHVAKHISVADDPKWKLTDLMIIYATLRANMRCGHLSKYDGLRHISQLDAKLNSLALEMPATWQFYTTIPDNKSDFLYNHHIDTYPDRYITQTWNVLRLVRLLLNETAVKLHRLEPAISDADFPEMTVMMAMTNIKKLSDEICASAPQYTDCKVAIQRKLPNLDLAQSFIQTNCLPHETSQNLDCYALIFPLYVVAHSFNTSNKTREWVIKQLHYIGDHFNIRNAEIVSQILRQGNDINPWWVYAMLGSYAFAA